MFGSVWKYIALYFTVEDRRGQLTGSGGWGGWVCVCGCLCVCVCVCVCVCGGGGGGGGGVSLLHIFLAVTWHSLLMQPSNTCHARKAWFKDTLFIGIRQGKPAAWAPVPCLELYISINIISQIVFLYNTFPKYNVRHYFDFVPSILRNDGYDKQIKSIHSFQRCTARFSIWEHRRNSVLLLMCVMISVPGLGYISDIWFEEQQRFW